MKSYIKNFSVEIIELLKSLPEEEIAKTLNILQAAYERDGKIYVFGNGGSLALANHWVSDFNKTVFSHHLDKQVKRFQAIRLPTTEEELTAWANDCGYENIFIEPLRNHLQSHDVVVAISSSGNSLNVVKAAEYAKNQKVPIIGFSGFDGGRLNELADAKIFIPTKKGQYEIVESVHSVILHLIIQYFREYFNYFFQK